MSRIVDVLRANYKITERDGVNWRAITNIIAFGVPCLIRFYNPEETDQKIKLKKELGQTQIEKEK